MTNIKFNTLVLVVMAFNLFLQSSCKKEDTMPRSIKEACDDVVYPHIALGASVGIVVGIIKNDKKSVFSYGDKELGKPGGLSSQSVFEIASSTKVFTAIALADMALKGELSLDDPIEKYLPASVKISSRNGKKITLKQLANHTSGLPALPTNMDKNAYNQYAGYSEEKMYDFLNNYSLSRDPGSEYDYSSPCFGLLGHILSRINGTDYETMISNRVLKPLNMPHTSISFTDEQQKNLAPGYHGSEKVESWSKYMQPVVQGAGALLSNMDDMLTFLNAAMGTKNTSLKGAITLSQQETFKVDKPEFYQNGIAMGWSLFDLNDDEIIWKNGQNGGYSSFIGFNKTTKTGVVILCNSSLNPDFFQSYMGFELLKQLKNL
ncbi:MAG: serine hydrolase domain-containing protein [Pelobium sp.]